MPAVAADRRGVSESAGVAALIMITLVATASVGLSVIIVADDGDDGGSGFSVDFQYSGDLSQLTVFYNGDEEVQAGNIVFDGPSTNVTWAELADVSADEPVAPGDRPVFLNEGSAYGGNVGESDSVRVVYSPPDDEVVTVVWNEAAAGGDEESPEGSAPAVPPELR